MSIVAQLNGADLGYDEASFARRRRLHVVTGIAQFAASVDALPGHDRGNRIAAAGKPVLIDEVNKRDHESKSLLLQIPSVTHDAGGP